MSIQSTVYITREHAISRIKEIAELFNAKNYKEIESQSFELSQDGGRLQDVVDSWTAIDTSTIENWTDEMLADYMDNPFFRHSLFKNYLIEEE